MWSSRFGSENHCAYHKVPLVSIKLTLYHEFQAGRDISDEGNPPNTWIVKSLNSININGAEIKAMGCFILDLEAQQGSLFHRNKKKRKENRPKVRIYKCPSASSK